MELARVTDYAVRAVMYLSINGGLCRTQDVSEAMRVPKAYLSKVLQELGRRDIVRLKPGVRGGVMLVPDPAELTLLEVVEAMEGRLAFNRCSYAPGECTFSSMCPVHPFWMELENVVAERLGSMTFAEFAARGLAATQQPKDSAANASAVAASSGRESAGGN